MRALPTFPPGQHLLYKYFLLGYTRSSLRTKQLGLDVIGGEIVVLKRAFGSHNIPDEARVGESDDIGRQRARSRSQASLYLTVFPRTYVTGPQDPRVNQISSLERGKNGIQYCMRNFI